MRGCTLKTLNTSFVDCFSHSDYPKERGSFCEREQISKEIDNHGTSNRNRGTVIFVVMTTLSSLFSSACNVSFTYIYLYILQVLGLK